MERNAPESDKDPIQKGRNVGLYPEDIAAATRIKEHYGLDSFSQAVRRAIRVLAQVVDDERREQAA